MKTFLYWVLAPWETASPMIPPPSTRLSRWDERSLCLTRAWGYVDSNIRVVDNMQVVGEKAGMALAPTLIVAASDTAAFRHDATEHVFHCVFENLACRAAPNVAGAAFYAQRSRSRYAAYFTF